jgi:hypothetical protein
VSQAATIEELERELAERVAETAMHGPRPRILLPGPNRPESQFADEVGKVLAQSQAAFRFNDRVVEVENEEFNEELDRFKLAKGGPKFKPLTPVRAKTWTEQFAQIGANIESKAQRGKSVFTVKTMSESVARSLLESPQFLKRIPSVARILDIPIPIRTAGDDITSSRLEGALLSILPTAD